MLRFTGLHKESACQCKRHQEVRVRSPGQEDALEEEPAARSSILAWKIPWTEEPGGLQSMGSDTTECLSEHTHTHRISNTVEMLC